MRRTRRIVLGLLVAALYAPPMAAQTPSASDTEPVVAELRKLNLMLSEITKLLGQQVAVERLSLLIKRVESEQGVIRNLENRARQIDAEVALVERARGLQVNALDAWSLQLQELPSEADGAPLEARLSEGRAELEGLEQRGLQLAEEKEAVEAEIVAKRQELETWTALLDAGIKAP